MKLLRFLIVAGCLLLINADGFRSEEEQFLNSANNTLLSIGEREEFLLLIEEQNLPQWCIAIQASGQYTVI
jgi:hypothetical protein